MMNAVRTRRGISRVDVLVTVVTFIGIIAVVLPALGAGRRLAAVDQSHVNLRRLGIANAVYAADWNQRQPTFVDDAISSYGSNVADAFDGYTNANGGWSDPDNWHPPITLGWGMFNESVVLFAYYCSGSVANASLTLPITGLGEYTEYYGSFRLANTRQFRQYVSSHFYDPTFYAPTDEVVYGLAEDLFDDPWEFVHTPPVSGFGDVPVWASYIYSPAAMFHPDVMAAPPDGGWRYPWFIDHGFESPGFDQVRYSNLKTLMIEHHWLQNAPAEQCNPAIKQGHYNGCEPWYFNHGLASSPVSLFYDLSIRELPNTEVQAADQAMIERVGYGLWSRDTYFGEDGYRISAGFDDVNLSHHILTTGGILGRDTTE